MPFGLSLEECQDCFLESASKEPSKNMGVNPAVLEMRRYGKMQ